jgi:hypothetical protein
LVQPADEIFFRKVNIGQIPILIVFTQFDDLIAKQERRLRKTGIQVTYLESEAEKAAEAEYSKKYRGYLEQEFRLAGKVTFARVGIPGAEDEDYRTNYRANE